MSTSPLQPETYVYYPSVPGNERMNTFNMLRCAFPTAELAAIALYTLAKKNRRPIDEVQVKAYKAPLSEEELENLRQNELGGFDLFILSTYGFAMTNPVGEPVLLKSEDIEFLISARDQEQTK